MVISNLNIYLYFIDQLSYINFKLQSLFKNLKMSGNKRMTQDEPLDWSVKSKKMRMTQEVPLDLPKKTLDEKDIFNLRNFVASQVQDFTRQMQQYAKQMQDDAGTTGDDVADNGKT